MPAGAIAPDALPPRPYVGDPGPYSSCPAELMAARTAFIGAGITMQDKYNALATAHANLMSAWNTYAGDDGVPPVVAVIPDPGVVPTMLGDPGDTTPIPT